MKNSLEAPAVLYTSYKDADGWEWCLTIREDSGTEALDKMAQAKARLISESCTPIPLRNTSGGYPKRQEGPTKPCPTHNVPMKQNKNGNWYHSRGVYPAMQYCNGRGFPNEDTTLDIADF